jgi:predicted nucleic acid-binding protein
LIVLDTNIFIRLVIGDIPEQLEKVKKVLKTDNHFIVPDVVFPEIEYILRKYYQLSRKDVIDTYITIAQLPNISLSKECLVAISLYKDTNLDSEDCFVAAYSMLGELASFDKQLLKIPEVHPYWK